MKRREAFMKTRTQAWGVKGFKSKKDLAMFVFN